MSFQGDPWICYHVDELMPESDFFRLNEILHKRMCISEVFQPTAFDERGTVSVHEAQEHGLQGRLYNCIQDVVARLERSSTDDGLRSRRLISTLQQLLTSPSALGLTSKFHLLQMFPMHACTHILY